MDGCRARRRQMMRYLDNELGAYETMLFDEHLKECSLCASFVERSRNLDELLEKTLAPSGDSEQSADFVNRTLEKLESTTARPAVESAPVPSLVNLRTLGPLAAAAAALLFLFWAFSTMERETPDAPSLADSISESAQDGSGNPEEKRVTSPILHLPAPPVSRAKRDEAYAELRSILVTLDSCPVDELIGRFEEETRLLRDRSWRVDVMLVGALRREEGTALRSAIRLVTQIAGTAPLPDVSHSLEGLIHDGHFAADAMECLSALGTDRAVNALCDLLRHSTHRDRALRHLAGMDTQSATKAITDSLRVEIDRGTLSPFGVACARTLSRMGEKGLSGIVDVCARSRSSHAFARALAPLADDFAAQLVEILPELEGAALRAGIGLAASLRIDGTVDQLRERSRDRAIRDEAPRLLATIGGPSAIRTLVDIYQGPVSLRERRTLVAALSDVYDLYPEETDQTMTVLFGGWMSSVELIDPEGGPSDGEVLLEMLSQCTGRGACRALSWIVKNVPRCAPDAALSLARTGSDEALDELLAVLDDLRLSHEARIAAAAAAFHLAGPSILDRIKKSLEADPGLLSGGGTPPKSAVGASRRSRLTQTGFRKLQNYILSRID